MNLPQSVKNTLWSYDISQIDIQKDKNIIIFNILNFGTIESIKWLYRTYTKEDIINSISSSSSNSNTNNWSSKSLNYWSAYFSTMPQTKNRFV